jgi:ribokinase
MSGIAVVGSNMVDMISYIDRMPAEGETLDARGFSIGCGGKGANQAVAAARLGARVLMVTRVGDDLFADNTIANFEANGIDTRHVLRTAAPSGVAPIFVDPDSRNRILIVKGANALLTPEDIRRAESEIAESDLVILQLEIELAAVYETIALAAEHGIPVLLNPAPARADLDHQVLGRCEFVMPNESELAILTGLPVSSLAEIRVAARQLLVTGPRQVIVTLGERGSLWANAEQELLVPAAPAAAVDTTGAGDAFIGAFADTWTRTHDVSAALQRATRYAADSVTKRGTQSSYASLAEFGEQPAPDAEGVSA